MGWIFVRGSNGAAVRWPALAWCLALVAVLMMTLSEVPAAAAPAQAPPPTTPPAAASATEAVDIPSARATARVSGGRVEAMSERTETSSTFVNPDGTVSTKLHTGPVHVRRGDAWLPVDLTLTKGADGVIRPVAHPRGLELAGAGPAGAARDLAVVRGTGRDTGPGDDSEVALQWAEALPEPVLEGSRATYRDVRPGADLVVQATRTGFEQYLVLRTRPTAAVQLTLPLRTSGIEARATDAGNTELVDATGTVVGSVPTPQMWDARIDPASGLPARTVPIAQQVTRSATGLIIGLVPDLGFLRDPATVYPVIVDPAVGTSYNSFDTFTQSNTSADQSTATQMSMGTYNGGSVKARSFMHFPVGQFAGKRILSANLWLYAVHAYSCAPRNWEVWDTAQVGPGTRWSNQPGGFTRWAVSNTTRGYTNCDDQWISTPVGNLVQAWANGGTNIGAMMLKAENENDTYGWKRFSSGEGGAPPHLEVTYNTPPNPVTNLTVSDRGEHNGQAFTRSATPTFSFTASDPDGDHVTAAFYVYSADGTLVHDQWVGGVPNGSVARWQVPAGLLQPGQRYQFRATTFDDKDFANDAWVALRSVHSGRYVDVDGCGTVNGTRVIQWHGNGADCQKFFPFGTGDGHYVWRAKHSGQVLDNSGCRNTNGNPVIMYDNVAGPCQRWTINRLGAGQYSFGLKDTDKVLDQGCGSNADTTAVVIHQRTDNTCQRWQIESSPARGVAVQWLDLTVDTTAPGAPFVSSTDYPSDGGWHGAAGQAGTFTFAPPSGATDVTGYVWGLDGVPATDVAAGSDGRATASVAPATDGQHVLNVRTKDRAGNLSAIVSYGFQVGRGGVVRPTDGQRVVRQVVLATQARPEFTHVRYLYRRGEGAAVETDVPAAHLRRAGGQPWGTGFQPLTAGSAVWAAADTVGASTGVLQVKAVLATDATGSGAYTSPWRSMVVDPDADGAATEQLGPGTLNLQTGDYAVSATDIEEFGLSVSRTSSSRDPRAGLQTQRERLSVNQQKVSTDASGFTGVNATIARDTTRGHTGTDSLRITTAGAAGNNDTFAAIGDEYVSAHGMKPGRQYRLTGWVYVPAASGLTAPNGRALKFSVHHNVAGAYPEQLSPAPTVVDAWQQLTLDIAVPTNATQSFIRFNSGYDRASGKSVFLDDLSLRELTSPFGPTWDTGVAADASGVDYTRLDFEADTDNTVVRINTASGGSIWFSRALDGRFFPAPGAEDLTLTADGPTYRLTELDGTVTTFAQQGGSNTFLVATTSPPAIGQTTRYVYENADDRLRVARVIAPTEPGIGDCTLPTPARGCEALQYSYATATTASGTGLGDFLDQVRSVSIWTTDPATGTVSATEVARYAYDTAGRLREVHDPRISSLVTRYEYDGDGRLVTAIPAGELPFRFDHGQAGPADDPNAGRLLRVRRPALRQGTTNVQDGETASTVVYRVPLTRSAGGPHDMDATSVARWAQAEAPVEATAVFPPQEPASVATATTTAPGADGYRTATIAYLDASGRKVNTAEPGAGGIDARTYDRTGNVVRELTARHRALALAPSTDAGLRSLGLAQADTATRAMKLSTETRYSPDGLDELYEISPLRSTVLPEAPDQTITARAVAENLYDEGKPDGQTYHLTTTTIGYALVDGRPGRYDPRITRTSYDPAIGGADGWAMKKPTQVLANLIGTDTGFATAAGGDREVLTTRTAYDDRGRVLEVRPHGAEGGDAATTLTTYWTAGPHPTDPECGNRPEWAGGLCTTRAGGAITGHDASRMAAELPLERVTAYNRYGDTSTVLRSAVGLTRTTTLTYDAAGRQLTSTLTGGLGTPTPAVTTVYDPTTGRGVGYRFDDGTAVTTQYDQLGRVVRYTDADNGFTATEYDRFGAAVRVTDSTGAVQTMIYDRAAEPRGLLTRMADSVAGTFDPTWDIDDQMVAMAMPGGVRMTQTTDASGVPLTRTYTGSTGAVIASSTQTIDINAHKTRLTTDATDQRYTYDSRARLVRTTDVGSATGDCSVRDYQFDDRTNRIGKAVRFGAPAGACPNTAVTPTTAATHTYDSADRAQDPGLRYDAFGRITTLPTTAPQTGPELINGFYTNDLVASQVHGDRRQSWALDPSLRFRSWTSERRVDGTWTGATTTINHYGNGTDEPRWITEDAGRPDAITRYIPGPDGLLAATSGTSGAVVLQLTSMHDDVMATLPLTNGSQGPISLHSVDEFGVAQNSSAASSRYSWLGGHQRSANALGDTILMGARLYHPASGRFLSVDPVSGGSATAYDYAFANPVNRIDLDGRVSWLRSAWETAKSWGRRALNNPIVRGVATGIVVGAICVGTAGVGCAILVGAAAGAALGGANWYVNHRRQPWYHHVGRGALQGAFSGGIAGSIARIVARRFPVAVSHHASRYVRARSRYSASNLWSFQRIVRSRAQARFKGRYGR